MTKQEQLKGHYKVNDYWICERLRYLIQEYGYDSVELGLLNDYRLGILGRHLDNLTLTYTQDSVTYNWDQVFARAA